jgi:LemA protein
LIPNLVECVKGYSKYEKEIFENVVSLRTRYINNNKINLKQAEELNNNINKIIAVAENYPELKSSENYKTLQQTIVDVEEHLQAARRLYNSNVSLYNQQLVSFPTSSVAKNKAMVKKDFFEIDEIKRNDVKIEL